jgi:hypothetical protein
MNTKLFLLSVALLSFLAFSSVSALSQTVITFDTLPLNTGSPIYIPNGYQGLSWSNFGCVNGLLTPTVYPSLTDGYYYGVVSASNVAFNVLGTPAEIDSPGTNFNFLSAYLTGAWHSNLNIEVQGFSGATMLYDTAVVAVATIPTLFTFGYRNIDRLYFNSFGGQPAFSTDGGNHFVMDNFTFEFVPEPSSFVLTGAGVLTLCVFRKRRRA